MLRMDGYVHYSRNWTRSLRKMRRPVQACNNDYVWSQQLAFQLSMYARNMSPPSSSTIKISPSQYDARSLSMTTHHRLAQMMTLFISQGCLVAIAGCSMTWSPFFLNQTRTISVKLDCCAPMLMIRPFHSCGQVFATLRVGMRFRDRILVGYPV